MGYEQITYAVAERIATITLNRPDARNAYTAEMAGEIGAAVRQADEDDEVRVIVLTGSGNDFCVGADLSGGSLSAVSDDDAWVEPATRAVRPLFEANKPVIAAVRGAAVGVGSTMILPADFRIAASDTRFGFVFARRGIYPEGASTWFLPRIVGLGRAMDWMVSGRLINADEALTAGLVSAVHAPEDVLEKAYELARELVEKVAPISAAVIRQALFRMSGFDSPHPAFALDSKLIASVVDNPDAVEGVISFLQRRPPEFTGLVSKDLPTFLPW